MMDLYLNKMKNSVSSFACLPKATEATGFCRRVFGFFFSLNLLRESQLASFPLAIISASSVALGIIFLIGSAIASPIMLSSAELEAIGAVSESSDSSQTAMLTAGNAAKIRLDGIVYHEENNWCVWLNGQRFSPQQHPSNYKIVKVCHDKIEIVSTDETEEVQPIILTLGQSY